MEVENTDLEFFSILEDEVSYFNKYMSVLIEEHNK
jgi:hypothetical protein